MERKQQFIKQQYDRFRDAAETRADTTKTENILQLSEMAVLRKVVTKTRSYRIRN